MGPKVSVIIPTHNRHDPLSQNYSFAKLIDLCGGHVDFLKCDCEGAEQFIPPPELKKIPKIEIELHDLNNPKIKELRAFLNSNWKAREEPFKGSRTNNSLVIHARQKNG